MSDPAPLPTAKTRVLVVEDDALITMMLEAMVEDLGASVVAACDSVADALREVERAAFDVAILDVDLNGASSAPVAEAAIARGKAVIYSTGYVAARLEGFPEAPVLAKPVEMAKLRDALEHAARAAARS